MDRPLILTGRQSLMRCLQLASRLNTELGFQDKRLRFSSRVTRGDILTLRLESSVLRDPGWPTDSACTLYLSGSNPISMHLSYSEDWMFSSRSKFRFTSSNLRFVIALDNDSGSLPLRLEWAGPRDNGSGRLEYPGQGGSAHPHWHIDLQELMTYEPGTQEVTVDVKQRDTIESIDLGATDVESVVPVYRTGPLNWISKIHLPARALWHERPYEIQGDAEGHQHKPVTVDELDNWILSAIRYLVAEFEAYA